MEACNSSYKPIKTQVIQSENVNREIEDENNHCRFGTYSHYWFSRKNKYLGMFKHEVYEMKLLEFKKQNKIGVKM